MLVGPVSLRSFAKTTDQRTVAIELLESFDFMSRLASVQIQIHRANGVAFSFFAWLKLES